MWQCICMQRLCSLAVFPFFVIILLCSGHFQASGSGPHGHSLFLCLSLARWFRVEGPSEQDDRFLPTLLLTICCGFSENVTFLMGQKYTYRNFHYIWCCMKLYNVAVIVVILFTVKCGNGQCGAVLMAIVSCLIMEWILINTKVILIALPICGGMYACKQLL